MFAPDVDQLHVIDHTKGAPMEGEKRYYIMATVKHRKGDGTSVSVLNNLMLC